MALATVENKERERIINISLIMYKYKLASEQQATRRRSAGAFKR